MTNFTDINYLRKEDVFRVPDNYFENLSGRIIQNTINDSGESSQTETNKSTSFFNRNRLIWGCVGAAACAALLFAVSQFTTGINNEETGNVLAKVENKKVTEYADTESNEESYFTDYTLIDGQDVYAYLEGGEIY